MITEKGAMFTWYKNSYLFRITPRIDDEVLRVGGEKIYLKDDTTGEIWQPTEESLARHGKGYTIFESRRGNLEVKVEVLVPINKSQKLIRLVFNNGSKLQKIISTTYFSQLILGESARRSRRDLQLSFDHKEGCLVAQNPKSDDFGDIKVYLGVNDGAISYDLDRTNFFGRSGNFELPQALLKFQLPSKNLNPNDPSAAISSLLRIPPGKSKSLIFVMSAKDKPDIDNLCDKLFEEELQKIKKYWSKISGQIEISTPNKELDVLFNKQLLYQVLASRLWARTGFYQPGGAYGYRDQLQDIVSLCWVLPDVAKEHILLAASRQFFGGGVQHWWHPPGNAGVRSHSSDAHLWLVHSTLEYVRITGDREILLEKRPFLETGKEEHHSRAYFSPNTSQKEYTLLEHCESAFHRTIYLLGDNGLPLILSGDWNDSLDLVGRDKRGESVWLAMFVSKLLSDFSNILIILKENKKADYYNEISKKLKEKIEEKCWDGDWYLRAFWDSGESLGGKKSEEMKIDSLPQSWAVISGLNEFRTEKSINSANKSLIDGKNKVVPLFEPPFEKTKYDPGYILLYPPGVRENGGAYSHAAIWLAQANALIGKEDIAMKILDFLNPLKRAVSDLDVEVYQGEPYVLAADIYTKKPYVGLAGWTWYTGSASLYYRVLIEDILGLKKEGEYLRLEPSVPQSWKGYSINYKYKKAVYTVEFKKSGKKGTKRILINGKETKSGQIKLQDTEKKYRVEVQY